MGIFSVGGLKKLWFFLCVLLCVLSGLLLSQYAFFCAQNDDLQLLQEHYQEHVDVLKRVIADVLVHTDCASVVQKTTVSKTTKKIKKTGISAKRKQLCQSLRTYLQQKDTHIDVHDLQEIYRSFDQPTELKVDNGDNQEVITKTLATESNSVSQISQHASKSKKAFDKKRVFGWPLEPDRFWVSSFFGRRKLAHGKWTFHAGLDMAALKGTPIHAVADGIVLEAGDSSNGYGNTILLSHEHGYKTRYAHLEHVNVRPKQKVRRGQIIGTVGDTGNVRGNGTDASHLHFEVHKYNRPVNPLYYLTR